MLSFGKTDKTMNAKQIIPVIAKIAPPLLIGVAVFLALKEIFSGEDAAKKPENTPTKTKTEPPRKKAETSVFRSIPEKTPVKPVTVPIPSARVPVVVPPNPVQSAVKIVAIVSPVPAVPIAKASAPVISPTKTTAKIPPKNRQFITREHLAAIFKNGARSLDRKAAVAALHDLGFGKTAAYAALSPDGRFSAWLQCAPDGVITWIK